MVSHCSKLDEICYAGDEEEENLARKREMEKRQSYMEKTVGSGRPEATGEEATGKGEGVKQPVRGGGGYEATG